MNQEKRLGRGKFRGQDSLGIYDTDLGNSGSVSGGSVSGGRENWPLEEEATELDDWKGARMEENVWSRDGRVSNNNDHIIRLVLFTNVESTQVGMTCG